MHSNCRWPKNSSTESPPKSRSLFFSNSLKHCNFSANYSLTLTPSSFSLDRPPTHPPQRNYSQQHLVFQSVLKKDLLAKRLIFFLGTGQLTRFQQYRETHKGKTLVPVDYSQFVLPNELGSPLYLSAKFFILYGVPKTRVCFYQV